jgi:hypothetical protein
MLVLVLAIPLLACNASTSTPLFLTIMEPANETVVDVNTVTIQGQTLANAMVSINGESVDVDSSGDFSLPVTLDEGPNVFDIIATDQAGDEVTTQLVVAYAP